MFGRSITIFIAQILSNGGYMGERPWQAQASPNLLALDGKGVWVPVVPVRI
jgi:hypothetical protein